MIIAIGVDVPYTLLLMSHSTEYLGTKWRICPINENSFNWKYFGNELEPFECDSGKRRTVELTLRTHLKEA